jgi:hypothetical protein
MKISGRAVGILAVLFSWAAVAAAAGAPAAASPREQAARELFDMVGGKNLAQTASMAMIAQLKSNPELAPYQDIFENWIRKIYANNPLDKEMVRLYAETFSEPELRQLIAFYKTPVGQKALQKMPELMQKGMAIGQQLAQAHLPELQAAIAARKRELEAKPKKP